MDILRMIGCGGHARSVADIVLDNEPSVQILFYDENAGQDERVFASHGEGFRVERLDRFDLTGSEKTMIAIGDNGRRKKAACYLDVLECDIAVIISKRAYVSRYAVVGRGCFVAESAHIGPEAYIGEYSILNTGSIIEHECRIGAFSHISIGAKVGGRSIIGDNVFMGAAAVVIDQIKVCSNVIIGAGAAVVSDIVQEGTYVGVPARKI